MKRELVVIEPDVSLSLKKDMLVFQRGDQVIRKSSLRQVQRILLLGHQSMSASLRFYVLRHGIDVVFLNTQGRYLGRLSSHVSRNGPLRLAQYAFCSASDTALPLAKVLVQAKIHNQRQLLLKRQRRLQSEALVQALSLLRRSYKQVEQALSIDQLMGYEGHAASVYFGVFPLLIQAEGFAMRGRSKRPPRDNVNAALSFGYTILAQLVDSAVHQAGLDPYLGVLHQARHGLPALVMDLVEPFRPWLVDALILTLINREQLRGGDFYHPEESEWAEAILEGEEPERDERPAVFMNETGRRIFFQGWHDRLRDGLIYPSQNRQLEIREIIQQEVYAVARLFQGEEAQFVPLQPR